jgi:hypothetical protein
VSRTFPAVFEIIERMHLKGDHYVKEAATIGMLEGISGRLILTHMTVTMHKKHTCISSMRFAISRTAQFSASTSFKLLKASMYGKLNLY